MMFLGYLVKGPGGVRNSKKSAGIAAGTLMWELPSETPLQAAVAAGQTV